MNCNLEIGVLLKLLSAIQIWYHFIISIFCIEEECLKGGGGCDGPALQHVTTCRAGVRLGAQGFPTLSAK